MRSLLTHFSLCLLITVVPGTAADGPRLLDRTIRQQPKDAAASIRIDVNMALVPVMVTDLTGHSVLGLGRGNFKVFDDGMERPIVSFGRQDAAVSVGLIFDCSRSMQEKFRTAREAPAELYRQLNAEDESFLVTVSDRSELRQSFTSNFTDIQNALLFTNPNGSTSLVDGVFLGLSHMKKARNPKKALVVVSDGGDNNSRYTLRELTAMAAESDTQIYAICLYDRPQTREEVDGPELLEKLVKSSGGLSYMVRDGKELSIAMSRIGVSLHNQYVLGYYPPDDAPSGKYRKIKVQLLLPAGLPKLQVYARSGYFVPGR